MQCRRSIASKPVDPNADRGGSASPWGNWPVSHTLDGLSRRQRPSRSLCHSRSLVSCGSESNLGSIRVASQCRHLRIALSPSERGSPGFSGLAADSACRDAAVARARLLSTADASDDFQHLSAGSSHAARLMQLGLIRTLFEGRRICRGPTDRASAASGLVPHPGQCRIYAAECAPRRYHRVFSAAVALVPEG